MKVYIVVTHTYIEMDEITTVEQVFDTKEKAQRYIKALEEENTNLEDDTEYVIVERAVR